VRDLAVLFLHLLVTVARLAGPGGARSVVAESVLVKHQLLILNRSRKRSPNLRSADRVVAGLCAFFIRPGRLRNPSWGCPPIAPQITLAFGISIDRDVVRRILAARYEPTPDSAGPSWLTVLGHAKDSLWSVDLFRCESAVLHTYWVLVVMDHWTRRIAVHGATLCRMFNHATGGQSVPTYLSAGHDPLYGFISGRRTCGSLTSVRSRRCRTRRSRIPLSNG